MLNGFASIASNRDRLIAVTSLTAITVIAWVYMIHAAGSMTNMDVITTHGMSMPAMQVWHISDFLLTFLMWTAMMAGMMIPSAAPMILTFMGMKRKRQPDQASLPAAFVFFLGYLAAWVLFSAAATLIQWGLHISNLLSPAMAGSNPFFNGTILIVAGIYQFTPLKKSLPIVLSDAAWIFDRRMAG